MGTQFRLLFVAMVTLASTGCSSLKLDLQQSTSSVCETPGATVESLSVLELPKAPAAFQSSYASLMLATPAADKLPSNISNTSISAGIEALKVPQDKVLNTSLSRVAALARALEVHTVEPTAAANAADKAQNIPVSANIVDAAKSARAFTAAFWSDFPPGLYPHSSAKPAQLPERRLTTLKTQKIKLLRQTLNTAQVDGFTALALHSLGQLQRLSELAHTNPSLYENQTFLTQLAEQEKEFRASVFLAVYFKAYFRGGSALQASLSVPDITSKIINDIEHTTKLKLSSSQKSQLQDAMSTHLLGKACKPNQDEKQCLLSRGFGNDQFTTRAGMAIQFAGISIAMGSAGAFKPTITYPQPTEFGPQLVRIATEAFFDSLGPAVPASTDSTACKLGLLPCAADHQKEALLKVDEYGNQAEALTSSAVGQIMRGASIAALNNEAIAKSVETLGGVVARKWVEKAAWQRQGNTQCDKTFTPEHVTVTQS